jgi:DNA primase
MLSSPIEEIKNRLDIVEVIGSYIKLQKTGANFRAPCPFHSEKKPSFFVSPARQIWHCFGCGRGSNIFGFVMEIEGVEFGDALRILAQKAGIELKKQDPKLRTQREKLYEICELACRFFEKQLEESRAGREARDYLLARAISQQSLKKWRIGYAPDSWQGLTDFLAGMGYKKDDVERAGLAVKGKEDWYDRFRGRIIFPVFDLNSQVVGFGGRVFKSDDTAKYLNTPGTLLYDKSRVLYGLDKAKVEIRKKNFCILAEGYTDVIMSSQAGLENAVATSGTALTPYQLRILKRYSDNLFLAFDMDVAGDWATKRGIDLALALGFNIKVITMPENSDPADFISKNPDGWSELVSRAKSILDFYFESACSRFDKNTSEGKKEISKILLPIIKKIPNEIERYHWIQKLSEILRVREEAVLAELKKTPKESLSPFLDQDSREQPSSSPKSRKELLEERIVSLVLKSPQHLSLVNEKYLCFFSPKMQAVLSGLKEDPEFQKRDLEELNYLYLKAEAEEPDLDIEAEVSSCLKEIYSLGIREKMDEISQSIRRAEEEKNTGEIDNLIQEFNKLANQLVSND